MKLQDTKIPGCYKIEFISREDARGSFVKTFHATAFRELGLESGFSEGFYSISNKNVLRGMHFQLPPADGTKLVYCLAPFWMWRWTCVSARHPTAGSLSLTSPPQTVKRRIFHAV
jgi:dTDP-4-dehydrorhamnose 3,5-epimerase-like enzyme